MMEHMEYSSGVITPEELSEDHSASNSLPTLRAYDSLESPKEVAVLLREANKSYGKGKGKRMVLDDLDMTVEKGAIYGLLGASGCGKTTILSCVVGRRKLDEGHVQVFGGVPGDRKTGVPGKRIGYMPQELALYSEFTAEETLNYFGRLYGKDRESIEKQQEFMLDFLGLPRNKMISNMSGGQQRRVSFAASLFHNPELLILDEPTVGVDPKLRKSIWSYLIKLARNQGKTIIITTHYIEEARQADVVGLMRNGKLLAEDTPQFLMDKYHSPSLEQVFLQLCSSAVDKEKETPQHCLKNQGLLFLHQYCDGTKIDNSCIRPLSFKVSPTDNDENLSMKKKWMEKRPIPMPSRKVPICDSLFLLPSLYVIWALMWKNCIKLRRNFHHLAFIFFLPAVQVIFFCIAVGGDPRGIKIAIVNNEINPFAQNINNNNNGTINDFKPREGLSHNCPVAKGCNLTHLSCRLYDSIFTPENHAASQALIPVFFPDDRSAHLATKSGRYWGSITAPANFSRFFLQRLTSTLDLDANIVNSSSVTVNLDHSNQQVLLSVKRTLYDRYEEFYKGILNNCSFPEEAGDLPMVFGKPVYGSERANFTEFMAPGIIVLMVFFLALALTGELFVAEKMEGLLDRSWIAGVLPIEVLIAHFLTFFCTIILQTATTLIFILLVFGIPCQGPVGWLIGLTLLQGTAGLCYGMLVSSIFSNVTSTMQMSISSFYPNLLLSGIIWPIEGMPWALQKVAWYLPCTAACQAARDIMSRGWGITERTVYMGYVSSLCWIGTFLVLSLVVIKMKSN